MRGVWPVRQVRYAEQRVLERVPDGALMAIAARAIAVQAVGMLGFSYGARVVLLVGAGDNGGDALLAGAELARRGAKVHAVLADPDRVHQPGLAALRRSGGVVADIDTVARADIVIDGLLGIGSSGPLRASLEPLVDLAESLGAPVLAVDIASGVDPDTGAVLGRAITASVTLCMGVLKPGLVIGSGREHTGTVRVVDIGLAPELAEARLWRLTDDDVAAVLSMPSAADDKYSRGVVGVVAGSARYPGAAQLAVGSARLGGVGAVRYAGHAAAEVVRRWPETLVTDTPGEAGRVQAWVIGPGLSDADDAVAALEHVLGQDVAVLVDADGLGLLGDRRSLLAQRSAPTVLTPHAGEFARFFPDLAELLKTDRLAAVRQAAAGCGATVLLKGNATITAQPDGVAYVNPTGSPPLATAGSGDVLSGFVGSLLATGAEPAQAAAVGAYLHGLAGSTAAADGPVVAMDLVAALRRVLAGFRQSWPATSRV